MFSIVVPSCHHLRTLSRRSHTPSRFPFRQVLYIMARKDLKAFILRKALILHTLPICHKAHKVLKARHRLALVALLVLLRPFRTQCHTGHLVKWSITPTFQHLSNKPSHGQYCPTT